MNREAWLTELALNIEPIFKAKGYGLEKYKLTCGWPCQRGLSARARVLGECHAIASSKAGVSEVFVSPTLDLPIQVAGVVTHELIHVSVGTKEKHKGRFVKAMKHLGMAGKPTHTLPGPALNEKLLRITEKLGPYPHQALNPVMVKVPSKGLPKLVCPGCGCSFRIAQKWLAEVGVPTCGCGSLFEVEG